MYNGFSDDEITDLMEIWRNGQISTDKLVEIVCRKDRKYEVSLTDFETIIDRTANAAEKKLIMEKCNAANNKKIK